MNTAQSISFRHTKRLSNPKKQEAREERTDLCFRLAYSHKGRPDRGVST